MPLLGSAYLPQSPLTAQPMCKPYACAIHKTITNLYAPESASANPNLLLIAANIIVCMLSKSKVARISAITLVRMGTPSCYLAATCYTAMCGMAAVAATSELINSLAAYFLSASDPFRTTPSNIYICNITASLMPRAPVAPCSTKVCPGNAMLATGIYCTITA